jgi:hypothetical protein
MGDLQVALRRTLPLLTGLAALYLACWLVLGAGVLAHEPHVLGYAITADLTLSATLAVWWFGVRRGLLPRHALLVTPAIGFGAAMLMLPQMRMAHLRMLGFAWAALEVIALVALLAQSRRVVRATRHALRCGAWLPDALEQGIASALWQQLWVARVLANELCVVHYALSGWFRRPVRAPVGERVFSHAGLVQWRALLGALALLLAAEGLAAHVLLSMASEVAAWIWTGGELYVLFWLLGDYQLLRLNPLRLTPQALHVELGLRGRATIPLRAITSVRQVASSADVEGVVLKLFGEPDVLLELNSEIEVLRGLTRVRCRTIALRAGPLAPLLASAARSINTHAAPSGVSVGSMPA